MKKARLSAGFLAEEVGFEPTVGTNPQRFSRPSHSAALAPFRSGTLSAFGEKIGQQCRTLGGKNAVAERRIVVETRIGTHVVQARGGTGLQVGGTENQATDAGIQQSAGTHHAGLECDVQGAIIESPAPEARGSILQSKHLGMCRRVARLLTLVVSRSDDLSVVHHDGTDRNIAVCKRHLRLAQCIAHRLLVGCELGA
jgi:hypothetical protein